MHVDDNFARDAEIKYHAKVIMDFSSVAFDRSVSAIIAVKPFVKLGVDFGVNVACHEIINMELHSVLFKFDPFVSNTGIIRIEFVALRLEFTAELLVPQESSMEHAVKGFQYNKI